MYLVKSGMLLLRIGRLWVNMEEQYMQGCGQGWRESQWGQWYHKTGYIKGKGILWILYEECIREGKTGCGENKDLISSVSMKGHSALEEDGGSGDREEWMKSKYISEQAQQWLLCYVVGPY